MATTTNYGLTLMDQGSLITAATMNTNLNKIDTAIKNASGSGGGLNIKAACILTSSTEISGRRASSNSYTAYTKAVWQLDSNVVSSGITGNSTIKKTITLTNSNTTIAGPSDATVAIVNVVIAAGGTHSTNSSRAAPFVKLRIVRNSSTFLDRAWYIPSTCTPSKDGCVQYSAWSVFETNKYNPFYVAGSVLRSTGDYDWSGMQFEYMAVIYI